ncbi:MAG: hypothetical protein MJ241_04620 [Bacilli bacterium]|nr:hypothetical protein [Bacilli bacterium]
MKKPVLLLSIMMTVSLCACSGNANANIISPDDAGTATIKIHKDNGSTSVNRYVPPSNVKLQYTYNDLSGLLENNESFCPSVGDVNLLVIPVHLPGVNKFKTNNVISDIEDVFFSKNNSDMPTPSLSEFFERSSYGKLNLGGTVTDWFDVEKETGMSSINEVTEDSINDVILPSALKWAKDTQGIDLSEYDSNNDGSIDGIWLIYDQLDVENQMYFDYRRSPETFNSYSYNQYLWKTATWDLTTSPNIKKPTSSGYCWASFDMMYSTYANRDANEIIIDEDFKNPTLDPRIFIQETAHLMGLTDYQSQASSSHLSGSFSMNDGGVGDFDSYSKLCLGWVTPYVVYGSSEIVLPSLTSSEHSVIVIPSDFEKLSDTIENRAANGSIKSFTYEFNPFSEYMLIDMYTPDGLNKVDVYGTEDNKFAYARPKGTSASGIRVYHIDSRIFKCRVIQYEGGYTLRYANGYVWKGEELDENEVIFMPISNDYVESTYYYLPNSFDFFERIRMMEATGSESFSSGKAMDDESLFTTKTKAFDINSFGYQFFNSKYSFNTGDDLPFKIEVKTLRGVK